MATTSWPTFRRPLWRRATGRPVAATWSTAMSTAASAPMMAAGRRRPSANTAVMLRAPRTTCSLVRMRPLESKITPDPWPAERPRPDSTFTTAGPTRSAALLTAVE